MTNFQLPKTPQRRLSRRFHNFKATVFGHCRNPTSMEPSSADACESQHSMITTSPINSPFRVALQHTDIATDSIVITSLYFPGGVPFNSHQDLLDMDRSALLSLARTLNDKLPKSLEIVTACSTPDIRAQIEHIVGINVKPTQGLEPIMEEGKPIRGSPPLSPLALRRSPNSQNAKTKSSVLGTPSLARLIEVEEPQEATERPVKRRKVSGLTYGAELHLLSPTGRLSGPRVRNPLPLLRSNSAQENPSPRHTVTMRRACSLKLPSEMAVDTAFVTFTRPKYRARRSEAENKLPSSPTDIDMKEPLATPKIKVPLQTKAGTLLLDADAVRKVQNAFPEVVSSTNSPTLSSVRTIKPLPRDLQGKVRTGPPVIKPSNSVNVLSTSRSYVSVFAFPASGSLSFNDLSSRSRSSSPSTPTKHRYAPVASSPLVVHPPLSTSGPLRHKGTFGQDENIGLGVTQSKVFLCTPSGRLSGSDVDSTGATSASPGSSLCSSDEESLSSKRVGTDEDVFGKKKMLESNRRACVRARSAKKRQMKIQKASLKRRDD